MIPFFYLTYEKNGLDLQQVTEAVNGGNQTKTKVLKVMRNRQNNFFEFFEFESLPSAQGFDVLSLSQIDMPLWNVPDFFRKHLRDLILGGPVNEANPHMVIVRLAEAQGPLQFMISYNKRKYASE